MDSLTQIVLGAACGEAVAGRHLGNRAMLWGAIGGTIPDLDVMAELFTNRLTAMSFHRGFTHSVTFAFLAPWVLAWLAQLFYSQRIYQLRGYKILAGLIWVLFFLIAAAGVNYIPVVLFGHISWYILIPTLILGFWFALWLWRDYWMRDLGPVQAPYRTWVLLFFWSIFTHPLLDCCTNFGTQLWQPFSDLRIQWNIISVVDPLYTVPFAFCLILAARLNRYQPLRLYLTWAGILWSCGYLAYTYYNKQRVGLLFEQALSEQQVEYRRYMTNPTLFNNVVWYGIAEADSVYYYSMVSLNDCQPRFEPWSTIPKNHHLLAHIPAEERAVRFLRWFSNGYYNVLPRGIAGDTLQVNDLRFGLHGDSLENHNYIFPFRLFRKPDGHWDISQRNRSPQEPAEIKRFLRQLWLRAQGQPCSERHSS
ncbi:MAG: metal-dependent hydrolase [Saprospiraceae bacterium]|nr:metal-dependent hydrolase [Saprospiraceae bacterium]MDW8483428.1 metal-dependent hydrolase [Saprospiraceae bacterium]